MSKPIRVVIVDDSAVVRQTLTQILSSDPGIQVLGAHGNPLLAMRALDREWPDVFTLDVEMPGMDGITFLREIMSTRPTPVVICSSLTVKGAATTLDALAAGAVDIVAKPSGGVKAHLLGARSELVMAVRNAAQANMSAMQRRRPRDAGSAATAGLTVAGASATGGAANAGSGAASGTASTASTAADARLLAARAQAAASAAGARAMHETTDRIVAIGASTGGTMALEKVLTALPRTAPGVVIVQHMPANFTRAFAERIDKLCQVRVKEAVDNERILPGHVYIARGGMHLLVKRTGAYYYTEVKDGPPVSRHKPSVNVLFNSVARTAGRNATGIIMTGMGDDGASGMLEMHRAGVRTFAQDEASCVVFGMPKEAIRAGGVDRVVALDDIAQIIGETPHF